MKKFSFDAKHYDRVSGWLGNVGYFTNKYILEQGPTALYIKNVGVQPDMAFEIDCHTEKELDQENITDEEAEELKELVRRIKADEADEVFKQDTMTDPCECGGPYKTVAPFIVWCDTCQQHFEVK